MEPVIEQIAEKIKARLGLVIGVDTVTRPLRLNDDPAGDYKITVTQGQQTENIALSCPGNPPAICYDQIFLINGELRPSEEDETPIDTYRNRFSADITKAITSETDWHNWDQLAVDTMLGPVAFRQSAESSWLEMQLMVRYRVSENDPYQVR